MAYRTFTNRDDKWQPRKGLEGPFFYITGHVLYYDTKEGQYWNPKTDIYMTQDEMDEINLETVKMLAR